MHTVLRIGTRGSQLALWQARAVATRLEAHGTSAELVIIRTSGDRLQEAPLSEVGGKRLFVKELEDALLRDDID
ncbi:MAG: hydroxymethylbilane synthase, partial [Vicinamibacterales bacterium]